MKSFPMSAILVLAGMTGLWEGSPALALQLGVNPPQIIKDDDGTLYPPDKILDLAATPVNSVSAELTWLAPKGYETSGKADHYEVYYSTEGEVSLNPAAAKKVAPSMGDVPVPQTAGSTEIMVVHGLNPDNQDLKVWFAVWAFNSTGQHSESNDTDEAALPSDHVPPDPVGDFGITSYSALSLKLQWKAPGDDGKQETVAGYQVRYSTEPVLDLADFAAATPVAEPIPPPAYPSYPQAMIVTPPGEGTWHYAIRALDEVGNEGPFETKGFTISSGNPQFDWDDPDSSGMCGGSAPDGPLGWSGAGLFFLAAAGLMVRGASSR